MLGIVDGGAGFAEAGGDELELAGEGGDVAGGEDAGAAGLHHVIDLDGAAFDFQAPVFYRTQGVVEAYVHEDGVDGEGLLVICTIVIDEGGFDAAATGDGFELVEEHEAGGTEAHFDDAVLVGAE